MKENEVQKLYKELLEQIDKIKNSRLKEATKRILIEKKEDIISRAASPDRFENETYVKGNHQFFKGGLLVHLLETTKYAIAIASVKKDEVNMDVIISGAALHDIGKVLTYEKWDEKRNLKNPASSLAKKFQHTYLGMTIVSKYFEEEKVDEEIKNNILHIIASHMTTSNKPELGALVSPDTIEAKIVSFSDKINFN